MGRKQVKPAENPNIHPDLIANDLVKEWADSLSPALRGLLEGYYLNRLRNRVRYAIEEAVRAATPADPVV